MKKRTRGDRARSDTIDTFESHSRAADRDRHRARVPRRERASCVRTFDEDAVGAPPPGFTFAIARQQAPGRWLVRAEGPNHYVTHLADSAAAGGFSLAVLDTPHPGTDARVRAAQADATANESAGSSGAIRTRRISISPRSICACRSWLSIASSRGNRIRLDDEDELELDASAWHSVRVVQDDDDIRVSLGGIGVIRARDRTIADEGGRAGVWSGGGATAWFDDLRIEPEENRGRDR